MTHIISRAAQSPESDRPTLPVSGSGLARPWHARVVTELGDELELVHADIVSQRTFPRKWTCHSTRRRSPRQSSTASTRSRPWTPMSRAMQPARSCCRPEAQELPLFLQQRTRRTRIPAFIPTPETLDTSAAHRPTSMLRRTAATATPASTFMQQRGVPVKMARPAPINHVRAEDHRPPRHPRFPPGRHPRGAGLAILSDGRATRQGIVAGHR